MILRLAVEQARSQKRYTIWTAALLTFALTLVSFSLVVLATQRETDRMVQQLEPYRAQQGTVVDSLLGPVPPEDEWPPDFLEYSWAPDNPIPFDDLDSSLEAALALGPGARAMRWASVPYGIDDVFDVDEFTKTLEIRALSGTYDWDLALGAGTPPGPGEIVVSAVFAERYGLEIGDTVALPTLSWDEQSDQPVFAWHNEFRISGLTRSGGENLGGYSSSAGPPEVYVSWEDSSKPDGLFTFQVTQPDDGRTVRGIQTYFYWDGYRPSLEALPGVRFFDQPSQWWSPAPMTAFVATGFALLVLLGTVIMAFSAGRSQAQVRLQWVATARTLGATRRTLAAAALTETLLVAVVAAVAGFLLGLGAAALHLAFARSLVPLPLLPDAVAVPVWIPAITVGAALLMASIVAAIPAFWASRVPPVAALKPINDLSEAEVSRRVKARWLVPPFVLGLVAIVLGAGEATIGQVIATLGGVVAVTTGFFLWLEGLRLAIPVLGRWLSRRSRPWAIAAGDALVSRPRQGVAPAFLQSLTLGIGTLLVTLASFDAVIEYVYFWNPDGTPESYPVYPGPLGTVGVAFVATTIGILLVIQVVILAITFMGQRASSIESATRRALGLSVSGQRRASFIQYASPQILGIVSGVVVGFIAAPFFRALNDMTTTYVGDMETSRPILDSLVRSAGTCGVVMVLALVIAAVGGLLVAASASSRTPVEALRQTG